MNWGKKLTLIQKLSDSWAMRNLTLIGKIYVIKSELLSKIIFCATILPIPEGVVKQLNKIFYKFIWKSTEKLQRKILSNDYQSGGLKMIDVEAQFHALKAAWLPRYLIDREKSSSWCIFPNLYFGLYGPQDTILKMNFIDKRMFPTIEKIPPFYQEVIIGYNITKNTTIPCTREMFLDTILWGNLLFTYKVRSKTLVLSDYNCFAGNVIKVGDLMFRNHKIDKNYIFDKLCTKANFFVVINHIVSALKPYMYMVDHHTPEHDRNIGWSYIPLRDDNIVNIYKLKSKFFYNCIIDKITEVPYTLIKWEQLFCDIDINFPHCFISRIKNIKDYKLAEFNYKFYHSILPTDKNLCRWKIQDDDKCKYCNVINDEIHMLFTCNKISALWNSLKYSSFFKVELRNSHAAKLVFFNNDLDQETISVLSCLCYSIYTEWLDRKNKDIDRSYNDILLFIKMKLKYKMSIYKYLKWNNLTLKIVTLLNSF